MIPLPKCGPSPDTMVTDAPVLTQWSSEKNTPGEGSIGALEASIYKTKKGRRERRVGGWGGELQ